MFKPFIHILIILISTKLFSFQELKVQRDSIVLDSLNKLDEIIISKRKKTSSKSFINSQNIINVSSEELLKAACCNLSESFETNPSIDVNFSDAISGNKQISMLGLKGPYILISQENIPVLRGGAQTYGLTFFPGTWIESMQITKGMGSVINGFQSIAGQINFEIKKPYNEPPFFVNIYSNLKGKKEFNFHFTKKINQKLFSSLFFHGNERKMRMDDNGDDFLDAPLNNQINFINRWQYLDLEKGWISFLNIQGVRENKISGNINYDFQRDYKSNSIWGSRTETNRFDISYKLGYVFPDTPYNNFGLQISKNHHDQNSIFGLRQYNLNHQSLFGSLLFNTIIGNTLNKIKLGISFSKDKYDEDADLFSFKREDSSFGAFIEYALEGVEKISLISGLRIDNHNRFGTFLTPRFHLRYSLSDRSSLKFSIGSGRRIKNIFAENQKLFSSNRLIQIDKKNGSIYGLMPEKAYNYGFSFIQGFTFLKNQGQFSIDYYKTDFINQVIVDWENPKTVFFYNLDGKSYSNSFQLEIDYNLFRKLDLKIAYKNQKTLTDYKIGRLQRPLTPENRFFLNLSYIKDKNGLDTWRFDYTLQGIGKQRIPENILNFDDSFSKKYFISNFQITKVFSEKFELYSGIENLGGYTQKNPIIGSKDPFGLNFDSTLIYAPIMGEIIYFGLRYN